MWIEIKEKRNLNAALQKAAARDGVIASLAAEAPKEVKQPKQAVVKKKKKRSFSEKLKELDSKKAVRRVCWVLLLAGIAGLIFLTILNGIQTKDNEYLNSLQDTRLVLYEVGMQDVKNITLLYNIHDSTSYEYAREHLNLSDDLRKRLFPTKYYTGEDMEEAEVVINDIRYELTEDSYTRYLVYLTRRTSTGTKYFRAIVVLEDGEIVDWLNFD